MTPSHHCEFTSAHRFRALDVKIHPQVLDKFSPGSRDGSSDLQTICKSLNWEDKWLCVVRNTESTEAIYIPQSVQERSNILCSWICSAFVDMKSACKRLRESGGGLVKLFISLHHPEVIVHQWNAKDKTKQQHYPKPNFRPVFHWF